MIRTLLCAAAASALLAGAPMAAAQTQDIASVTALSRAITVPKDKSMAFRLDAEVGELVIAQPDIAEIVAKTDRSFYIRGKTFGATNILVYGPNQQLIEVIDVRVAPDAEALRQDLQATMPGERIQVSHLADGFLLSGQVSTSAMATRALAVAARYAGEAVSSNMQVTNPEQVVLEVRILEANRVSLRDMGINLAVTGTDVQVLTGSGLLGISPPAGLINGQAVLGNTSIDVTLRALEERGLVRTLAEPNLVALSGAEASFLAGGEFPFPVPAGRDQVTIEFKPFGVTLKFTPEVRDNGRIRLKVEPEVSQLDEQTSVRIDGIDVPGLSVRRASTTVELDEGRSFAIAGLFQRDMINSARQVPGLGNVPILGALFRSERWREQETELVIIVTPRLADMNAPIPNPLEADVEMNRPAEASPPPRVAETFAPVPAPTPAALASPTVDPAPTPVADAPPSISLEEVVVVTAPARERVQSRAATDETLEGLIDRLTRSASPAEGV